MSLNLNPGAPPIFLGPPIFNAASDVAGQMVATSMQGIAHRLYQLDPTAPWQGSLGASDSNTEKVVIGFYKGSMQISVPIDTVTLLNHNLNNFLIEYCTDYTPGTGGAAGTGTWQTFDSQNITGQAAADYLHIAASPVTCNGIRLTMTTTSPANLNKSLCNFIVALSTFQMGNPPTIMKPSYRQRRIDVPLADGSIDTTYLMWSDNSFTMTDYEIEIDFANIYSATDKSSFDALFKSPNPFLFYPEPGDAPRNIHLSLFDPKSYVAGYNSQWKGGGRKIPFKTMMVGYL
jgi:hypothetical protein